MTIGLALVGITSAAGDVWAADPVPGSMPTVGATAAPPGPTAPAVPPPPYSLPWQLRPVTVGNVVRSDTSLALYDTNDKGGVTVASSLLASYKVLPNLAPMARLVFVENQEPGPMGHGFSLVNPVVGATYAQKVGSDFKAAGFLGATIPVGMGGDKAAGMDETAAATAKGVAARSGMDNAMFAVNYFTAIVGADFAYVAHKLTVQAEATLLQLWRVRNEKFAPDETRTNMTAGLHAGYFVMPMMSLGGELRYQRWLSTPASVKANPAARETVTFAVGPRFHFKMNGMWIRPGLSYSQGLDDPLAKSNYKIVQLDVPFVF